MDIRKKLFISHASEDKETVAKPLSNALINYGFRVWYDEYSLFMGDSLKGSIDRGLSQCDYAIIILSPAFFSKHWTREELDGVVALENLRRVKILLPIMHRLTYKQIVPFSPTLAGKKMINFDIGIEKVIKAISEAINAESRKKLGKDFFKSLNIDAVTISPNQKKELYMHLYGHSGAIDLNTGKMTTIKSPEISWKEFHKSLSEPFAKLDDIKNESKNRCDTDSNKKNDDG